MKRARPTTSQEHGACNNTLRVDMQFKTPRQQEWTVEQIGPQADFEDGISTDSVDLVIYFQPPLPVSELPCTQMAIHYVGTKQKLVWAKTLAKAEDGEPLHLVPEELEYRCYETYQLQLQKEKVLALFCTIENGSLSTAKNVELVLRVHVDMKRPFLASALGEQGHFLAWFPPNVDPAHWGLTIDPRSIPQRTPLWFKLRGEVSGSRAYYLLGWYTNGGPMTLFSKSAMRLGTFSEDLVLICYCYTWPERQVREMGWCPAPPQSPLVQGTKGQIPLGWGASPDALIFDPEMSWDLIPEDLVPYYADPAVRSQFDIRQGAGEFKTSRTKLTVEPYFVAQVYMEMIALNVVWCDLIRFRPARTWDAAAGRWRYDDVANVYRIFRNPLMEARLIPLWKRAQTNQHAILRIIEEPEFVRIREEITEFAAKQKPYTVIQVAAHPKLAAQLNSYRSYAEAAAQPEEVWLPSEADPEDAHWVLIEERQQELRKCRGRRDARFTTLVAQQMQAYAGLLL